MLSVFSARDVCYLSCHWELPIVLSGLDPSVVFLLVLILSQPLVTKPDIKNGLVVLRTLRLLRRLPSLCLIPPLLYLSITHQRRFWRSDLNNSWGMVRRVGRQKSISSFLPFSLSTQSACRDLEGNNNSGGILKGGRSRDRSVTPQWPSLYWGEKVKKKEK